MLKQYVYLRNSKLCVHKLLFYKMKLRIIFGCLKDTFIKKLRSSYKMEFV